MGSLFDAFLYLNLTGRADAKLLIAACLPVAYCTLAVFYGKHLGSFKGFCFFLYRRTLYCFFDRLNRHLLPGLADDKIQCFIAADLFPCKCNNCLCFAGICVAFVGNGILIRRNSASICILHHNARCFGLSIIGIGVFF